MRLQSILGAHSDLGHLLIQNEVKGVPLLARLDPAKLWDTLARNQLRANSNYRVKALGAAIEFNSGNARTLNLACIAA